MRRREIENSTVELIFAYFESLDDEKTNKKYKNFGINFTSKFNVLYDFYENKISIERKNKQNLDDFWRVTKEKSNVMNMSLILGENGIGKTTLLRAIAACTTENIESDINNYILIYYIKELDSFFIKSTCKELFDLKGIKETPQSKGFKNIIYRGLRKDVPIFGYYGIAVVNKDGKLRPEGEIKCVNTLYKTRVLGEILPMNCFYLPVISDNNSTRFIEREKLLQTIRETNDLDILKFILIDYKNVGKGFITEYPKFRLTGTSAKQTKNTKKFQEYSLALFEAVKMGSYFKVGRYGHVKNKFCVHCDIYSPDDSKSKEIFFVGILVKFLARLSLEYSLTHSNDELFYKILDLLHASMGEEDIFYVYEKLESISRNILLNYRKEYYKKYKKITECIENLPRSYFKKDNINITLSKVYCEFSIDDIAEDSGKHFVDFIEEIYEFEAQMGTNRETLAFMDLKISEMSTGEYSLLRDVFARISTLKRNTELTQYKKSILLILDEPDIGLHLRWTQNFIYTLIETLENLYGENKFQIILTSHMPFLVTDFPRSSVICLCDSVWRHENEDIEFDWVDGYKGIIEGLRGFHPKNGFMCNYYDILRDAFFIDIPIGTFAQFKYRQLNDEIEKCGNDVSKKKIEELESKIEIIDEQVLKKVLQNKLDTYKTKVDRIQELKEQMKIIQNEIRKLEDEQL